MKSSIQITKAIARVTNPHRYSLWRRGVLLILLALACFALSPAARAVNPAPDGGYPGENTAEGDSALFNLDTSQGFNNTAVGYQALFNSSTGGENTATGNHALFTNTTGASNTATGDRALYKIGRAHV